MQPPGPSAQGGDGKGKSETVRGSVPAFKAGEGPLRGPFGQARGADQ